MGERLPQELVARPHPNPAPQERGGGELKALTILAQSAVTEHVDRALLDCQIGGAFGCFEAQGHHQCPRGSAMGDRDRVDHQLIVPLIRACTET